MASEKFSLRRLQSLESEFSSLEEQLPELENIVFSYHENKSQDEDKDSIFLSKYQGRKSWALRWALKKIQTPEDQPFQSCLSPKLWQLLIRLTRHIESSTVVKLLHSCNILDCLDRTLSVAAQFYKWDDKFIAIVDTPRLVLGRASNGEKQVQSDNSKSELSDGIQKRRPSESSLERPAKRHKRNDEARKDGAQTTADFPFDLFDAISEFLSVMIRFPYQHPFPTDHYGSNQLPNPLSNADPTKAASIVGNWLRAMNALECYIETSLPGGYSENVNFVFQIWSNRSLSRLSGQPNEDIELCSKHCLLPCLGLLLRLSRGSASRAHRYNSSIDATVEQFVARQLLVPAKSSFQSKTSAKLANGINETSAGEELSKMLQPIMEALHSQGAENALISGINSLLTELYLLSVKCTRLSSPKSRLRELPWLEELFLRLCSTVKMDVRGAEPVQKPTMAQHMLLNNLLEIARKHKINLSNGILQAIIQRYSGLAEANTDDVNWSLLEKVLAMNSKVFVPNKRTGDSVEENSSSGIPSALFRRFSQSFYWTDDKFVIPLGSGDEAVSWERAQQRIAMPLFEAYVEARMVPEFLELWHEHLSIFYLESSENKQSILEDKTLLSVITDALETSLTTNKILQILSRRANELEDDDAKTSTERIPMHQKRASSMVLTVIFGTVVKVSELRQAVTLHNGGIFRQVFGGTTKTLCNLLKEWLANNEGHTVIPPVQLWQLLAVAHRCWASSIDIENTTLKRLLDDDILDEMMTLLKDTQTSMSEQTAVQREANNINAIACMQMFCNVLNDLRVRKWPRESLRKALTISLQWLVMFETSPSELDVETGVKLIVMMSRYTAVLDESGLGLHELSNLFRVIPKLNAGKMRPSSDITTTLSTALSVIVEWSSKNSNKLLQTCLKLLPPLLEELAETTEVSYSEGLEPWVESSAFSCLQIRTLAPSRNEKTKLLGTLISKVSSEPSPNLHQLSQRLRNIFHLLLSQDDSDFGMEWTKVITLTRSLDEIILRSASLLDALLEVLHTLKEIAARSIRHEVSNVPKGQNASLLHMLESLDSAELFNKSPIEILGSLSVLSSVLEKVRDSHAAGMDDKTFEEAEEQLSAKICALKLESLEERQGAELDLSRSLPPYRIMMDILNKFSGTALRGRWLAIENMLKASMLLVEMTKDSRSADIIECGDVLHVLVLQLRWKYNVQQNQEIPDFHESYGLLDQSTSRVVKGYLENALSQVHATMDQQQREGMLEKLLEQCQASNMDQSPRRWALLQMLLSAVSGTQMGKLSMPFIAHSWISHLLTVLATALPMKIHSQSTLIIASTILELLQHTNYRKAINQIAIDSILSGTAAVLSLSGKKQQHASEQNISGNLYNRLTAILRVILLQHRHRLRGRFDLLISTLQALLRPLFASSPAGKSTTNISRLTEKHAEKFTRLITLLCDPTVSSTTTATYSGGGGSDTKRQNLPLTDETVKARKYAGQYVPALLLSLCEMQLQGEFVADGVREALAPGVYVMFDVMGSEVLGAVFEAGGDGEKGEGMSSGVRTVFRGWWEAWKRERKRRTA